MWSYPLRDASGGASGASAPFAGKSVTASAKLRPSASSSSANASDHSARIPRLTPTPRSSTTSPSREGLAADPASDPAFVSVSSRGGLRAAATAATTPRTPRSSSAACARRGSIVVVGAR
jgi:hypothetical protein